MDSCCNTAYQKTFDDASARKEMKRYLAKGIKKSSRPLAAALRKLSLEGKTQLDIGAGIGALIFESFDRGLKRATYVDIAVGYREQFLEEAKKRDLTESIEAKQGDFLEVREGLSPADLVTLDKVICCYEDYEGLVRHSVSMARRWYVYSIPRDVWWVRLVHRFGLWVNRLMGNSFRSYIHPPEKIEALVAAAGFHQIDRGRQREWEVMVFEKG